MLTSELKLRDIKQGCLNAAKYAHKDASVFQWHCVLIFVYGRSNATVA